MPLQILLMNNYFGTRSLSDFTGTYYEKACLVHIPDPFRQIATAISSQTIENLPSNSLSLATVRKVR